MKKSCVLFLLVLVSTSQAEVHFQATDFQVGAVKSGVPLIRRFEMVNRGPGPVEVREIRIGCGCIKPKLDPAPERLPCTLAPGEKRTVVLEVNTLSQAEGEQSWYATVVLAEGGKLREQRLTLSGKVVHEVSVLPAALYIFTESPIKHNVTLTDRRPQPLSVIGVSIGLPHLKAHSRPATAANQELRAFGIELEVTADCPEGRYDTILSIATNDPTYSEIKVPVTVVRRGVQKIKVAPDSVWLQAAAGEPVPSRLLRVYDGSNRPVVLDRVVPEDPAVTATWKEGTDGTATVKVMVDRTKMSGSRLVTAIRIELSQPERQTLTLPVTCVLE